jgi:hypothetical protein
MYYYRYYHYMCVCMHASIYYNYYSVNYYSVVHHTYACMHACTRTVTTNYYCRTITTNYCTTKDHNKWCTIIVHAVGLSHIHMRRRIHVWSYAACVV